ncbi:MAG: DNA-deoxyinosine glycosylase [Methanomicrobiales archaeon]|nr:DNA-deoxyinosine glycosylase [Methanomicrobiales archaeon]
MTRRATRHRGIPPAAGTHPAVLILGSFPSVQSLVAGEYYANPRNRFWAVMEELLGIDRTLPYRERLRLLGDRGTALWDVIGDCAREGSGDGAIRDPVLNDIPGFLHAHPTLRLVVLNGSAAGRLFRSAWPGALPAGVRYAVLPSTSPANARYRLPELLVRWRVILAAVEPVSDAG